MGHKEEEMTDRMLDKRSLTQASAWTELLSRRLSLSEVHQICIMVSEGWDEAVMERLLSLALCDSKPISVNALWIFTHLPEPDHVWLADRQDVLIDALLKTTHTGRRRLLLKLLSLQPFRKEAIRTDFLDYCLNQVTACTQPYAIRALCLKLAFEQCKYFPPILEELTTVLDMLSEEKLSPGMVSACCQVRRKIARREKIQSVSSRVS